MANLNIGDKVRFLNDVGGGIITQITGDKMAVVKTEDGFDIPVLQKELVKEAGMESMAEKEESKPVAVQRQNEEGTFISNSSIFESHPEVNIIFAVILEDEQLKFSKLKPFLINDSSYFFSFSLGLLKQDKVFYLVNNRIEPETKLLVDEINIEELFSYDVIVIQGFLNFPNEHKIQPVIDKRIPTGDITILKMRNFKENDYFDEKASLFFLNEEEKPLKGKMTLDEMKEMLAEKDNTEQDSKPGKKEKTSDIEEVDLHIHEITDDYLDLSNGEIVRIQIGRFETALETAIRSNTKKVVFIHGVGNGSLKQEIRSLLERKYNHLKYQDASFKEYGYGATLVHL